MGTSGTERLKNKTLIGLVWMFLERIGAQVVTFIVSIVLARLLMPEEYGIISLVMVLINVCNVFVEGGFGKSLVQKKDADDLDYSTVFYFSVVFSVVLYIIVYWSAPYVAGFYNMEILAPVIRVMGIRFIIGSFNTIQRARVSRDLQFRKFFCSTIIGTILSAFIGILLAFNGYGVWSLVGQYLSNTVINTFVLFVTVRWRPRIMFSFERMKMLIKYGWKVLIASLVDVLYEDFRTLYIGKLYSPQDLAYYTRGKQFPYLIVDNVNSSITSVLFPVMSQKQDNSYEIKKITRRSIKTSAFIMMPLLFGLAAIAEPLVLLILTEKWLPCVPFLQVLCFNAALMPIQSANVQAIYAIGRSDIVLRLNIIKKLFGFFMVLFFARISIMAMVIAGVVTGVFCLVVNASPNRKLLDYGYFEQIKDVLPYVALSGVMCVVVISIGLIDFPVHFTLLIQVIVGAMVYILLSKMFHIDSFEYIQNSIKSILKKDVP